MEFPRVTQAGSALASAFMLIAASFVMPQTARAQITACTVTQLGCTVGTSTCTISQPVTVPNGCHFQFGATQHVNVNANMTAQNAAGDFQITAGSLTLNNAKLISPGPTSPSANDGVITLRLGNGAFRTTGASSGVSIGSCGGLAKFDVEADSVSIEAGTISVESTKSGSAFLEDCYAGSAIMEATDGSVSVASGAIVTTEASQITNAGDITLIGEDIAISGTLNASGGEVGVIALQATEGDVGVTSGAQILVKVTDPDTFSGGGDFNIDAPSGSVTFEGLINGTGTAKYMTSSSMSIDAGGNVIVKGTVNLRGIKADAVSGDFLVTSGGSIDIYVFVDQRGGGDLTSGNLKLEADANITIHSTGILDTTAGQGQSPHADIRLIAGQTLTMNGIIRSKAPSSKYIGAGGYVLLRACTLSINGDFDVSGFENPGNIDLEGGTVTIGSAASFVANPCPVADEYSCNTIRTSGSPTIASGASFSPAYDQDPITGDPCTGGSGCGSCNDSNVCTTDSCVNDSCQHTPVANCCTSAAQCGDGNSCTTDTCTNNQCAHAGNADCCTSAADCGDSDACTTDACVNNECVNTAISNCCNTNAECADTDLCTFDSCVNHICKNTAISGCCNNDSQCADTKVCTADTCTGPGGVCQHPAIANCCTRDRDCADDTECIEVDCNTSTNQCESTAVPSCCDSDADCNDGNACTVDNCNNGTCENPDASDSVECDDGDACTDDDSCLGGACVGDVITCDDGDFCNGVETCNANNGLCVDGTPSSDPSCEPGDDDDDDDGGSPKVAGCSLQTGTPSNASWMLFVAIFLLLSVRRRVAWRRF